MKANQGACSIEGCIKPAWSRGWCRMHYYRWSKHGDPNKAKFIPAKPGVPAAFIADLPLEGDGCVIWPFAKNGAGYGQINVGAGRKVLAHRLSCERRSGPAPSAIHQAAHTCGKGHLGCVAPWHLEWKLPVENMADQIEHGTRSRGEAHALKLNDAAVLAIRALDHTESHSRIALRFGVSQTMVSRIIRREAWAHVADIDTVGSAA